jgi:hypothetical protein
MITSGEMDPENSSISLLQEYEQIHTTFEFTVLAVMLVLTLKLSRTLSMVIWFTAAFTRAKPGFLYCSK